METTTTQAVPAFTPGPWPWEYNGDRKRIIIGAGLVEGPDGYEVAEVYSDDCDKAISEANACLISAAPDLHEIVRRFVLTYECVALVTRTGEPTHLMQSARAALAKVNGVQQ